jgi:hypothetical protein
MASLEKSYWGRPEVRRAFPCSQYSRRALVETVFSTVKRKLSARAPGRSLFMQLRQALLLGSAYNLIPPLGSGRKT